jgi:hypothetical protein
MRILWLFLFCCSLFLPAARPAHAAIVRQDAGSEQAITPSSSQYDTTATAAGVALQWRLAAAPASVATATVTDRLWTTLQRWPQAPFGTYQLPMRLETVVLPDNGPVTPVVEGLEAMLWAGGLPAAAPLTPATDWQGLAPPRFREVQNVPTAPVFLLREGRMRGLRLGVIAVSPLYIEDGVPKIALAGRATIPGARALTTTESTGMISAANQGAAPLSVLDRSTFTNQPVPLSPPPVGPTNPALNKNPFKIGVSAAGLQRLTGPTLLAVGLGAGAPLGQLLLTWQGAPRPLEIRDDDGLLDANTEIRFYAEPAPASLQVGDRWNITDTYWLTSEPAATPQGHPRMSVRNAFPKVATLRQSAYEEGIWEKNQIYESTMPGVDGDHWFGASLEIEIVQPDNPASYPTKGLTLTHALPLEVGSGLPSTFRLTGSARSVATHTLQVYAGNVIQPLTWANHTYYANWQQSFTRTVQTDRLDLVLIAVQDPSMIRVDKIFWRQPVNLEFGGKGATFAGVAGQWRYQLQNTPPDRTLYDITDPTTPVVLQIPGGPKAQFEDGPTARRYLLTGPGTLHQPTITRYQPVTLSAAAGADAVYITPAWLQDELTPLVEHRRQQGYQVAVVDVQAIYDAWSYGQISASAIRDFLRYAVSNWQPAPMAAILVGDSTLDPRNYTGVRNGDANVNVLPAYLAPIDPWIIETACENCFAQLDGADPLDTEADPSFLDDIAVGRLSVQNKEQLRVVVEKILYYETHVPTEPTALYVADNYIQSNGAKDPAGDFAYFSDLIIQGDLTKGIGAVQPPQIQTRRVYYDPSADGVSRPWREPDGRTARLRVIEEINRGPGLITYNGHGNHLLWATTNPVLEPPYLFNANDVFELKNGARPSILLEMTCFTGQFVFISPSGHTIDERFLRHNNGGAVAVWSSSGLTVAVGHDWMQQGFHRKLWQSPPFQARLGDLITAGYLNLFQATPCCQETRYVYLLLGDPLTPVMMWPPKTSYLPLIHR